MDIPKIAQKSPIIQKVQPGIYYWCACGESETQPFCNDSHKITNFEPVDIVITEEKNVAWCACKQTGKKPFCDGTHKRL